MENNTQLCPTDAYSPRYGQYGNQKGVDEKVYDQNSKGFLTHDVWNHPNDPTDFERTLNCHTCRKDGHATRTCRSRSRQNRYSEHGYLAEDSTMAYDFEQDGLLEQPSAAYYDYIARQQALGETIYDNSEISSSYHVEDSDVAYSQGYSSSRIPTQSTSFFTSSSDVVINESSSLYSNLTSLIGYFFFIVRSVAWFIHQLLSIPLKIYSYFFLRPTNEYALMVEETQNQSSKRPNSFSNSTSKRITQKILDYISFIVDSGATRHLSNLPIEYFSDFEHHTKENGVSIRIANDQFIHSIGEGNLGPLSNVLCVPSLSQNLFSVRQACSHGYKILFQEGKCDIFEADSIHIVSQPVATAEPKGKLYEFRIYPNPDDSEFMQSYSRPGTLILHMLPIQFLSMFMKLNTIVYLILVTAQWLI